MNRDAILQLLQKAHLVYLGALPALATFVILWQHGGGRWLMAIFMGGVAAVGVYLAYTGSYIKMPVQSIPLSLFMLVDGPLIALTSVGWNESQLWSFAIEGYLIDGLAVWLGIFLLAFVSDAPTPNQRFWSIVFMLVAMGVNLLLFRPYIGAELWGNWWRLGWLLFGVVEATAVSFRLLARDAVIRDSEWTMGYILGFLFLWLVALFAGNIFFELRMG